MGYKVAFHYWRYGVGGAERVTSALLKRFVESDNVVTLYTDLAPEGDDNPLPNGVERVVVPQRRNERDAFWREEARRRSLDVIVYSSWLSPFAADDIKVLRASDVRVIYSVHGSCAYFVDKDDGIRLLDTMLDCAQTADAVVSLSEADALFWGCLSARSYCVANPVADYLDPRARPPRDRRGHTIVWCGRLDPAEKRPDLAIRTLSELVGSVSDVRLLLVGGGAPEELDRLVNLARSLHVEDCVEFVGQVADPTSYYRRADVFLMTSPTEGFPLVLAEAMREGLPAVMFEMPYLTLAEGCSGVIQVPWADSGKMARALRWVLRDLPEDDYRKLSASVCESYERVCTVDVGAQWLEIVSEVCDSENPGHPSQASASNLLFTFLGGYRRAMERREEQERERTRLLDALKTSEYRAGLLSDEVSSLRASVSFRLGRTLTAPLRVARSFLSG